MNRRSARGLASALALSLVVAGCAPTQSAPLPEPTPATVPPTPAGGPRWTVETLSHDDPARPVHLQWPVVPGANALTRLLAEDLGAREARFLAEGTPSAPPGSSAPSGAAHLELRGTWETVLDAPAWVGIRTSVYEYAGGSGTETTSVHYGERAMGQALRSPDLIAPSARRAAGSAVVEALRADGHPVLDDLAANPEVLDALLQDLTFSPRGELIARVAEGTVLPAGEGIVEARVAPSVVEGLLSQQGWRVRDAATGLVRTPSPTAAEPVASPPPAPVDCSVVACVALTFDDGPGKDTGRLLDELADHGTPATFFVLGTSVRTSPDLVRRMAAEGHEVGNHTWDHRQLTRLDPAAQRTEVERARAEIERTGVRPTVFRPPYGSYDATTRQVAGLPIVLWDVDTLDWRTHSADATVSAAVDGAGRGSIVLLHDIHPWTVDAVPRIIEGLHQRGFTLVTVSELLGPTQPGTVHSRR